jgi:hypothetical protein
LLLLNINFLCEWLSISEGGEGGEGY